MLDRLLNLLFLLCVLLLSFWCITLEKNQRTLIKELYKYQEQTVRRNEQQDKEIRLIKQDIILLESIDLIK